MAVVGNEGTCLRCLRDKLTSTSTCQVPKIPLLEIYKEALTAFSHIFGPDGLNNTLLSKAISLEQFSLWEHWQNVHSKDRGGAKETLHRSGSWVKRQSCPLAYHRHYGQMAGGKPLPFALGTELVWYGVGNSKKRPIYFKV